MTETALRDPAAAEIRPDAPRAFGRAGQDKNMPKTPAAGFRLSRGMLLRLAILALAMGSGYGAFELASAPKQDVAAPVAVMAPPPVETEDVLVAHTPLELGHVLAADDIGWMAWPKKFVAEEAIRRSQSPHAREELTGAIVRSPFVKGELLRADKIVQAKGAGFLAAILPSGVRAMAIAIDAQGATTAGGFILPNDRVDVIRTLVRPDPAGKHEGLVQSETVIANVRVLAIGQNIQEKNGERVITGTTATLEVEPQQAEVLAQAQRSGQISLVLRSLKDASEKPAPQMKSETSVTVMRGGKKQDYAVRDSAR